MAGGMSAGRGRDSDVGKDSTVAGGAEAAATTAAEVA